MILSQAPRYSNENVTIFWSFNEEATSTCTLDTPQNFLVVACDQNATLTFLTDGVHTLYISATDLAGNIAPTVRHSWTVGMAFVLVVCFSHCYTHHFFVQIPLHPLSTSWRHPHL